LNGKRTLEFRIRNENLKIKTDGNGNRNSISDSETIFSIVSQPVSNDEIKRLSGGSVNIFNTSVPTIIPLFVSGAGASIISDIAHDELYPQLPTVAHKLSDVTAVATGTGISGAATAGILSLTGLPNDRLISAALIGGGSYVASDYIEMKLFTEIGNLIF